MSAFLLAFDALFGFTALLGLIALGGMIMRNTVILVEQIDKDQRPGLAQWEAIVEPTIRRSRPVVLTALAAILAMIPLSRGVFWAPMAITLMGGLLAGTVLTLLFLPALSSGSTCESPTALPCHQLTASTLRPQSRSRRGSRSVWRFLASEGRIHHSDPLEG